MLRVSIFEAPGMAELGLGLFAKVAGSRGKLHQML